MPLLAKDKGGVDFAPLPASMHHAVCYGVIDLGTQPSYDPKFPPRHKVRLLWEVPGERIDITKDNVTKNVARTISATYTLSLSAKGNLRPMLECWRGRSFTEAELKGFDMRAVLGANCLLNVVHVSKQQTDGMKTYANVASVNPLAKGMAKCAAENPLIYFSMDDIPGEIVFPSTLPEWITEDIKKSDEYLQRSRGGNRPSDSASDNPTGGSENHEDVPF